MVHEQRQPFHLAEQHTRVKRVSKNLLLLGCCGQLCISEPTWVQCDGNFSRIDFLLRRASHHTALRGLSCACVGQASRIVRPGRARE